MTHRIGVRGIAKRAHTINLAKMRTGIPITIKHTMYMNAIAINLHISAMLMLYFLWNIFSDFVVGMSAKL